MKIRNSFVSNSSISSFVVSEEEAHSLKGTVCFQVNFLSGTDGLEKGGCRYGAGRNG